MNPNEIIQNPKAKLSQLLSVAAELQVAYTGQSKEDFRKELAEKLGITLEETAPSLPPLPAVPEFRTALTGRFVELRTNAADLEPAKYREDETIDTLLKDVVDQGHLSTEQAESVYTDVLNAFCGKSGKKRKGRTAEEMAELRSKRKPKGEKAPKEPKQPKRIAVELTDEMKTCRDDNSLSKSEKIRKLHELGLPKNQISKELNAHYSFVHNTIANFEMKLKISRFETADAPVEADPVA